MRIEGWLEKIDFFADANDPTVTYAEFIVPAIGATASPYKAFVDINDDRLKAYIRKFILPNIEGDEKISATELLQDVKDIIALGGNPDSVAPRVRTAGKLKDGLIEYDLNNYKHEFVKVTPNGWDIVKKHKHKFLKRNTLGSQVTPVPTEKSLLTLLKPFVNTDKDGLILFAAWLVQAFCMGNHSAMLVQAPAGSGKSSLTKIARRVIDPSNLQANIMTGKKDDLFSALSNSYFVAFDNCSDEMSKEVSDILCAAITGSTIAKRKLYTTNELGVYELHTALILNGLDITPPFSDLASRCLLLKLKDIDASNRQTDEEFTAAFEKTLPEILGAIFNTLSTAMSIVITLKPAKLPRMASSYLQMLSLATAFGVPESEFERIYFENLNLIDKERANVAIVEAVQEYLNSDFVKGRSVSGKLSDLRQKIYANYSGKTSDLPASPSLFGRKLRQELKTFSAVGITVLLDNTFEDGTHLKLIKEK